MRGLAGRVRSLRPFEPRSRRGDFRSTAPAAIHHGTIAAGALDPVDPSASLRLCVSNSPLDKVCTSHSAAFRNLPPFQILIAAHHSGDSPMGDRRGSVTRRGWRFGRDSLGPAQSVPEPGNPHAVGARPAGPLPHGRSSSSSVRRCQSRPRDQSERAADEARLTTLTFRGYSSAHERLRSTGRHGRRGNWFGSFCAPPRCSRPAGPVRPSPRPKRRR